MIKNNTHKQQSPLVYGCLTSYCRSYEPDVPFTRLVARARRPFAIDFSIQYRSEYLTPHIQKHGFKTQNQAWPDLLDASQGMAGLSTSNSAGLTQKPDFHG